MDHSQCLVVSRQIPLLLFADGKIPRCRQNKSKSTRRTALSQSEAPQSSNDANLKPDITSGQVESREEEELVEVEQRFYFLKVNALELELQNYSVIVRKPSMQFQYYFQNQLKQFEMLRDAKKRANSLGFASVYDLHGAVVYGRQRRCRMSTLRAVHSSRGRPTCFSYSFDDQSTSNVLNSI